MTKYQHWLTGLLFALLLLYFPLAHANASSYPTTRMTYQHNVLTITNTADTPLNLQQAQLRFYSTKKINSLYDASKQGAPLQMQVQHSKTLPNSPGDVYYVKLKQLTPSTLPAHASISLTLNAEEGVNLRGLGLQLDALEPVPVAIKVIPAATVQTIRICNTTTAPIPLKHVELSFKYKGLINSVAGTPNLNWRILANTCNQYILSGGNATAADLAPDPLCRTPLNVQVATDNNKHTMKLFQFKVDNATPPPPPVNKGSLSVVLAMAPSNGLANPTVSVKGTSTSQAKVMAWGSAWKLDNLAPGNYTVTASNVNNGDNYFYANPVNATVIANTTANAAITYQAVTTSPLTVNLVNAPAAQSVSFKGRTYTFTKSINGAATILLPADTYTISAAASGYTVNIAPNPIAVPTNQVLTITYQRNNTSSKLAFGGYFESWDSNRTTDISNIPAYVSYVYLSFARPDNNYQKGSLNLSSTGLEFGYNGQALKEAVAQLHQKQPNTKVILSVGGATYNNWGAFNATACANIVKDLGLDGIDIDYEAANPGCAKGADGLIHCQIDASYQNIMHAIRVALPRPYLLTVAAWSISAYGEGQWANAAPRGNFTGMMLPYFRSQYANDLDVVNVMSYDAGPTFKPTEALAAFSHYFNGNILMGVEVPPEGWGGHVYTMSEVNALAQAVKTTSTARDATTGMMIWSLQKQPDGTPSQSNPNAQMMATSICGIFGLSNCSSPIISLR